MNDRRAVNSAFPTPNSALGRVSERLKELVLKTSVPKGTVGSNPTPTVTAKAFARKECLAEASGVRSRPWDSYPQDGRRPASRGIDAEGAGEAESHPNLSMNGIHNSPRPQRAQPRPGVGSHRDCKRSASRRRDHTTDRRRAPRASTGRAAAAVPQSPDRSNPARSGPSCRCGRAGDIVRLGLQLERLTKHRKA